MGVRSKLFLASLALVLAGVTAAQLFLVPRLERQRLRQLRVELERLALVARDRLLAEDDRDDAQAVAMHLTRLTGVRVTFIGGDGRVFGDGEVRPAELPRVESHADRPEVRDALAGRVGVSTRRSATVGVRYLYLALPPVAPQPIVARVALPLTEVEAEIAALRSSILAAGLLGLLVAAALSSLASQIIARPLRDMTVVARELAHRRFGDRVAARSRDEVGELGRALNALSTDLERTLTDLTHERDLLDAVLSGMAEGVLVTDSRARILRVNPALIRQLGIAPPPPSAEARSVLETTRSPDLAEHLRAVLEGDAPASTSVELAGPPPGVFVLSSAPLARGEGVVTVFHDVTELRRLERIRRDFVANVSHELRTPVAALQAAGETLLAGALADPARAREFTEIIARHAERLGQLVTDLLALAKLESGELDLTLGPVALRPLVDRVLDGLGPRIAARRLTVANEVPAEFRLQADERALEQVLVNLVDNAAKYTPEGGRAGVTAGYENGVARVVVWDTGPGIEPRHRQRIFERFYRVDPGRSRALGGTGLGLAIVRHMVEAMGGHAGVDSRGEGEGPGSRFWFTLPAR